MKTIRRGLNANRRWFLKNALVATGAAGVGTQLLADNGNDKLSKGDAALLRFAAAAEILESDFWVQYNELGGVPDNEVPGGTGNPIYTAALENLDEDFPQYIHDNTDDEITHFTFLNAYLTSKRAEPVNLDPFRLCRAAPRPDRAESRVSPILCDSPWTQVGGPGIAVVQTIRIWTRISCSPKPFRAWRPDSLRPFPERTPTCRQALISRR